MAAVSHAKRVLVPVANGSEDIESVTLIDIFRRAALNVDVASVGPDSNNTVKLARGCLLTADTNIESIPPDAVYDLIACPGGMPGAERLRDCARLTALLKAQASSGRHVAAVCAAPAVVLASHGILDGATKATCHGNFVSKLPNSSHADSRVVVDANIITSRGPGSTMEFALQCVAALLGREKALEVAAPLHLPDGVLQLQ